MGKRVEICICPTDLEVNGDRYDEEKLILAIRYFVLGRLGVGLEDIDVRIGYAQGVCWERFDGEPTAANEMMRHFWGYAYDPALFRTEGGAE